MSAAGSDTNSSGSLADRITMTNAATSSTGPGPSGDLDIWTDEPVTVASKSLENAQVDGNAESLGGSSLQEGEYEVEVKLSDLQGDSSSPLYSVQSFEQLGISEQILKGIYTMHFIKPSKIQEKALPLLLQDPPQNMIAQSQSGTGKTAAFVLTILSRLDMTNPTTPQALCLAPSRELARQIEGVINEVGRFLEGLTVQSAVPGALERGRHIQSQVVVGTPGTVMDLIKRRQFEVSGLKVLVLDEADNMLDQQGLGEQCARVKGMLPKTIQILLFSATFPDQVMKFAQKFSPSANEIKLRHEELTVAGIQQMYMDCPGEEGKYEYLVKLYGLMTVGSSIIFVKTRISAERIMQRMVAEGHKVSYLSGGQEGAERDRIIDSFRTGATKVLVTTNVLARGIDVQSVSMVINYDIPMKAPGEYEPDADTYLHRIGRTGRFGRVGVSISFVFDKRSYEALKAIADHYQIDLIRLDHEDWDECERQVQRVIKSSRAGINFTQR